MYTNDIVFARLVGQEQKGNLSQLHTHRNEKYRVEEASHEPAGMDRFELVERVREGWD